MHRLTTRFSIIAAALLAFTVALDPTTPAQASDVQSGFVEALVVSGLSAPTAMEFAPDGRLFVTQQAGDLRVIEDGVLLPTPFVSLNVTHNGERGLLGITFDPDFEINQYVYVYYTVATSPLHNRLSRFTANGNVALPGSEVVLLDLPNLSSATNHNGGAIHFGPIDGKLYIGVGENANGSNAQAFNTILGKILRINPDGTIPSDNPFYNTTTGNNRAIWALGVRNPYTFTFEAGTGRMFINDVGQSTWEEINDGIAGSNYGWPVTEGITTNPLYRSPLYVYGHGGGGSSGCAITGGAFYPPGVNQFPTQYAGRYFYADYCGGWIRVYDPVADTSSAFVSNAERGIVDLKISPDGALYYVSRSASSVFRIDYGTRPPTITKDPVPVTVTIGQAASFVCNASGTIPLNYQWQRDNVSISGETNATLTIPSPQMSDNGAAFRCVVTNDVPGTATSASAILTVTPDQRPTATITQPALGTLYEAGDTIAFAGTATDPEDGTLPLSAYTWWVDLHHEAHTHPEVLPDSGESGGSFIIPTTGETSVSVWYRIHLRVTDSSSLTDETFVDVLPRISTIRLASNVNGVAVNLDGQPQQLPLTFQSVVGMVRSIEAVSPQEVNGVPLGFVSWSDGGAAQHDIETPLAATTYTVTWGDPSPAAVPELTAPNDGASTTDNTPDFDWDSSARAVRYRFQLDDDADFSSPSLDVITTRTSFTLSYLVIGHYFWRVQAINIVGEPSAWVERTVTLDSALNASPSRNYFTTSTVLLTWSRITWATRYEVEVDNNNDFSSREFWDNNIASGSLSVSPTLDDGLYYWRVRARNNDQTGAWSPVEKFTVDAQD
jgi:glucose/arabinose dehydrogenase